jgi:hypothetical protein
MSTDRANALIVSGLAVTGVLAVTSDAYKGQAPPVRLAVGLTFAGVGLALLAEPFPDLAGGLAVLVMISAIFVHGGPVIGAVSSVVGATKSVTAPQPS